MASVDNPVAIIDGGGANIASLRFALERLGYRGELTTDHGLIRDAGRVILPGVGDAADAMRRLRAAGLDTVIPELTQPVLGICLGLQLLFDASEENATQCLGVMAGHATQFVATPDLSVPHMGWNQIFMQRDAPLLAGIPEGAYFYFVHSFAVGIVDATVATTDYGAPFTAVAQRDNFVATQFHPERSSSHGAQLLRNFLACEPT